MRTVSLILLLFLFFLVSKCFLLTCLSAGRSCHCRILLGLPQYNLDPGLLNQSAPRFILHANCGCHDLFLNSKSIILEYLGYCNNCCDCHAQSRELNFIMLLNVPLGKIDIKEKRFLGVGDLNPVLLWMVGACENGTCDNGACDINRGRENRSDGSFSGHFCSLE